MILIAYWCARYNHERFGTRTGKLGNKRTSCVHPNCIIVEIGLNTKRSPGDFRRLTITQISAKKSSANAGVKNFVKSKLIIIMIIGVLND